MKYCGIDLHSNNAVIAVIDDDDRLLYCKRLANDLGLIMGTLLPHRSDLNENTLVTERAEVGSFARFYSD